jgi:hypothetical protein
MGATGETDHHAKGVKLSQALGEAVVRRLRFAPNRTLHDIQSFTVRCSTNADFQSRRYGVARTYCSSAGAVLRLAGPKQLGELALVQGMCDVHGVRFTLRGRAAVRAGNYPWRHHWGTLLALARNVGHEDNPYSKPPKY